MKILQLITRLVRGGASRHVLDISRQLEQRGHDLIAGAGLDNTGPGSLLPEFKSARFRFVELRHLTRSPGFHDLLALLELIRLCRQHRPDILHLHTSKAGTLGVLAGRLTSVPSIIYSSHGHLFQENARIESVRLHGLARDGYRWLRRITIGLADRTLALSRQDLREQLELELGRERKYEIVPNGLGEKWFQSLDAKRKQAVQTKFALPKDRFIVTTVGRLVREKGQDDLINAWNYLDEPNRYHFVIAGDGPRSQYLKRQASKQKMEKQITFTGPIDEIKAILDLSDCFCFPSYYESQGIALMEAMARGLPCISTRAGGLAELMRDGVTGWSISPGQPREIARTIETIRRQPDSASIRGKKARKFIREFFHLDSVVNRLESLYKRRLP